MSAAGVAGERPLVVLQLVANRWWTGSADPVIQLSRGLRTRGHRVLLGVIPGGPFADKARAAGFVPEPGFALEARFDPRGWIGDVWRLRRLVEAERVDVVHVHHSHDHWVGRLGHRGAALVRTFHNLRSVATGPLARALYRATDGAMAVSRAIAERSAAAGLGAARVETIAGVVDAERFGGGGGEAMRKELGVGPGPVIGCVSRLAAHRGHEALIRGFSLLLSEYPDARLLLIGKGEMRGPLGTLVEDLALSPSVLFTGYRDVDLPAVLDALDVFALMGAGSDESCRAALEAMAAARPVAARRVGALGEAVLHRKTGLLIEDDRPESVARALRALVADPVRARAMGEAGRQRVLEECTPTRHAALVEGVYRRALGRASPG